MTSRSAESNPVTVELRGQKEQSQNINGLVFREMDQTKISLSFKKCYCLTEPQVFSLFPSNAAFMVDMQRKPFVAKLFMEP